jgi:acetolactate synthase-1/2/3 large subunit
MTTLRVSDWLMQAIAAAGIRHVFMIPGGGAMHLNDALARETRLRWVHCFHEQACGIAAEAWGRIAGQPGVAMVTTGPGATNIMTPLAAAWIESSPLLVVSGQVKRADMMKGAPLRQRGPQEVDAVSMVRSITKYAVTVEDPASIRLHFEKALHLATTGRRGPVWLEVPLDVQAAPVDPARLEGFVPEKQASPSPAHAREVAGLIARAERPLLLAGHGVRIAGAAELVRQVAERFGMPVATTWLALDLLPYEHPLSAGRPGVVALRTPNFAVQNCDLLVTVGARLDNIVTAYAPQQFGRAAKRVVVDVDPNELAKHRMETEFRIAADASDFLAALLRYAPAAVPARRSWLERIAGWKATYGPLAGRELPTTGPASHYQLMDELSALLPENTVIATGSSGLGVEVFYTSFRNKPGQRVFLTSGMGAMGYGLPAAIGACLAADSAPMVLVESDGSLMFNIQELATLRTLKLPIAIVLMNNSGYASIRNTQRNYFGGRYIATGPEAGVDLPDFVRVARSFGIEALAIEDVRELRDGLKRALARPRPILIDVRLMRDETLSPKVSSLAQPDGSMLTMPIEDMSPLLPLEALRAEMAVPLAPESLRANRDA